MLRPSRGHQTLSLFLFDITQVTPFDITAYYLYTTQNFSSILRIYFDRLLNCIDFHIDIGYTIDYWQG